MNYIKENNNLLKNKRIIYAGLGTVISLMTIIAGTVIAMNTGKNENDAHNSGNGKDKHAEPKSNSKSKTIGSRQGHGVAVGTSNLKLIYHGRNGEVIHIDTIPYPVDAYGDATEPIYNECDYVPKECIWDVPEYDYAGTAYTFPDGRGADNRVDLRDYINNGRIHLKME